MIAGRGRAERLDARQKRWPISNQNRYPSLSVRKVKVLLDPVQARLDAGDYRFEGRIGGHEARHVLSNPGQV